MFYRDYKLGRIIVLALVFGTSPWGAYAESMNLLANPGFESLTADQPDRWDNFVLQKPGAVARLDDTAHQGDYAVWLHTPTPYAKEPVNNWSQNIIGEFGGKTLRVGGYIRVAEAKEAALWLQCWRKRPWGVLASASTSIEMPVYGTADWQAVSMDVDVPPETDFVTLRCVLLGTGSAWFDDLSVTQVDGPVETEIAPDTDVAPIPMASPAVVPDASAPEALGASVPEAPASTITPEEAKRQEDLLMPMVTRLENEVLRLRDANLLLTGTLQQIQEVNQGLVTEMLSMQAQIDALKVNPEDEAGDGDKPDEGDRPDDGVDPEKKRILRGPPMIPLSEARRDGAP